MSIGAMMVSLDGMIVVVAQPVLQHELRAGLSQIQWVTNGYLLAVAALLITAGKLGDRFGHRRVFLAGVLGFTLSSVAIGLSDGIAWVVGLRALQGVFGALMQPATLGLVRNAFPPERLNMPIAVRSSIIAASTAAGPIVGGLVVEHASWRWIFFVNVPLGALALVLGLVGLREVRPDRAAKSFDMPGVVMLAVALCSLVWGLTRTPAAGGGYGQNLLFLGMATVLGCCFLWWESRVAEPLLPLRIFRSVQFSVGAFLTVVLAFVMIGAPFVLVFYLQNVQHLTPVESGVRVLGLTLMMIVGAPLVGLWMNRRGARTPIVFGMLATTVAMCALSRLGASSSSLQIMLCFFVLGFGFSPVKVGATKLVMSHAPVELSGVAGGIQQTAMQVGGSLGTALIAAIIGTRVNSTLPRQLSDAGFSLSTSQAYEASQAVAVGQSPGAALHLGTSDTLARIGQAVFLDGMQHALVATAVVAACGTGAALLIRRGSEQHADIRV
ncbi:MFS transporter [Streptomyces sp. NBC_01275]|uniref:MFS transporter n=1 Tax=Streptomyces sp. NBC_01275 TaxID=2903807 RepID=UPI00224D5DA2|nr:MFS transporter [Streptomyces sp. NBC_01275]MCX4763954.1 MFS transporter [Streptomyces sp. NBC_01275]